MIETIETLLTHYSLEDWLQGVSWGVFSLMNQKDLIYIGNLIVPLMIAVGVYAYYRHKQQLPDEPSLIGYLFPKRIWRNSLVKLDVYFYLCIKAVGIMLIFPLMGYLLGWTGDGFLWLLEYIFGPALSTGTLPTEGQKWLYTIIVFVALDFAFFYSHYLTHKYPFLWAFHKVHHSAEELIPLTAFRFHPFDMVWMASFSILFASIASGLAQYLFYNSTEEYLLFGHNVIIALAYLTTHNLRHSHIWLHYPKWMSWLLISPAQHQIHHSKNTEHFDKNFGYLLAPWDRWFGTLYTPEAKETFNVGISRMPEEGNRSHRSLSSLFIGPCLDAWDVLKRKNK